jgi:magnesium-transporting ATPase (P-type)
MNDQRPLTVHQRQQLEPILRAAALCGDAELVEEEGRWRCVGDPTEGALVALARKGGIERADLLRQMPRARAFPFDSERMRMSTLHPQPGGGALLLAKGAPEQILSICTSVATDAVAMPRSEHELSRILDHVDELTGHGLRVLAFAHRVFDETPSKMDEAERDLTFLGLVGLEDPIRPHVPSAIARCEKAGIRVVMITGDHPNTAASVARGVGIPTERVVVGSSIPDDEDALRTLLEDDRVGVLARVEPQQKLRIARCLQASGHVVAMTGDGVNDGPALRQADIGVAMGVAGTDVAREAADLVLLDDDFAHIVEAIEEGRAAFDNTRNFLTYHLTDNVAELAPFVLWALSRGTVPLLITVLQVLALDIGTDLLPALALGAEPPAADVMARRPRGPAEHLLDRSVLLRAFGWLGPIEALVSLGAAFLAAGAILGWHIGQPLPSSGSELALLSGVVFSSIVLMQMANAFECRSPTLSVFSRQVRSNHLLILAVFVEAGALALFLYVPALAAVLGGSAPTARAWAIVAMTPLLLLVMEEGRKLVARTSPRPSV